MGQIIFRTLFFYFFIALAYRIMGKREVGQLGIIDLIVSILVAELVAISIENYKDNIFLTIVPIVLLVAVELILGFVSVKSRKFNQLFGGKPTIIINQGKLLYNNLVSQRYSLDDLLLELRQSGIDSIEDVNYALLEPNGKLSIFKYDLLKRVKPIPLPLVLEGVIQKETLKNIDKDERWLLENLEHNKIALENVFYAFYNKEHIYVIRKS